MSSPSLPTGASISANGMSKPLLICCSACNVEHSWEFYQRKFGAVNMEQAINQVPGVFRNCKLCSDV